MRIKRNINFDFSALTDLMVEIPKGKIEQRDNRTHREWMTEIEPFLLSKYQVTQEFYAEIVKENPSEFKGNKLPVESVSWKESVLFCNQLSLLLGYSPCYAWKQGNHETIFDPTQNGFRLPSEAEWEYACKAGSKGVRYGELELIAWYKGNSEGTTHEVGLKEPNAWGIYDLLGNVWEWCSDVYDEKVYGSYRIMRGGGWCDEERGCLSTNRRRSHPTSFKIDDLGFRIARNHV